VRTCTIEPLTPAQLSATDLRAELAQAQRDGKPAEVYSITIWDATGTVRTPTSPQALYLPGEGRLGVDWGALATWASVTSLEASLELWLNNRDGWDDPS